MQLQHNISLANLTTIKLGGSAARFVSVASVEELKEALAYAKEQKLAMHVLGGGSNTIFPDRDFERLVIKIDIKGVEYKDEGDTTLITAGAGEDWDALVAQTIEKGLAGFECLSGIPGLVGGTPIQNVGAYGQEVRETITEVHAITVTNGEEVSFTNIECDFGYRMSRFKGADKGKYIVTRVVYRLQQNGKAKMAYLELAAEAGENATLLEVREAVLKLRKKKSMVLDPHDPNAVSCGSFFINPTVTPQELATLQEHAGSQVPNFPSGEKKKVSAAWLIERAGWEKGYIHDGVGISTNHALALINRGGGTAKDLIDLAEQIEKSVFEKFGIKLEREPVVVE